MVSTFTPNIQLEEPARGDDVGTWDTPVNNNMTLIDLVTGGMTTISLNNTNVTLASAQFQCKTITFNSTLTGSVTITFPTSFKKSYEIYHTCTGSSAFTITLATTAAGGQVIGVPPGTITHIINDGTNIKFTNLQPVGTYLDYAGGGLPSWISICTVPPYLDCNGQTFSATTYPALAAVLNSTTVPDFRGRAGFYLNEGTGRLTAAGAGINGDVNFQAGGNNGLTLSASQIPTITSQGANTVTVATSNIAGGFGSGSFPITPAGASIASLQVSAVAGGVYSGVSNTNAWTGINSLSGNNTITVTTVGTGGGIVPATVPGIVSGIRMIRAG